MIEPFRARADDHMPILGIRAGDVPERVLVVGDPSRAGRIAERLDGAEVLGSNREYTTFGGTHNGEYIGVVSHGVGSAGATVCFEELCRSGARRVIRAGTAGGMQDHIADGSLVVAKAAVRDEGVTGGLVPISFPAIADLDVVMSLRQAASQSTASVAEGVVLTNGIFYPHSVLGSDLELWQRSGVLAIEMECAALFIVASLHGAAAGAILVIDGNPLADDDADMSGYDPNRDLVTSAVEAMIQIALDAVAEPL